MNTHPDFRAYFEDVAKKLKLLGQQPGKVNLFFTEGPELASVLVQAIRTKLTLPCLLVEFYDEDNGNSDAKFQIIHSAFVVLDQAKSTNEGKEDIESAIYRRCKTAADQIFARMKKQSDRMQLKIGGEKAMLEGSSPGNWVGPLHNDLYGWRIEFNWRIAAGRCYNPEAWNE